MSLQTYERCGAEPTDAPMEAAEKWTVAASGSAISAAEAPAGAAGTIAAGEAPCPAAAEEDAPRSIGGIGAGASGARGAGSPPVGDWGAALAADSARGKSCTPSTRPMEERDGSDDGADSSRVGTASVIPSCDALFGGRTTNVPPH